MKTHIILLDNRFSFNRTSNDRLGEQQWQWLNNTLYKHSDSDLTLVLAGIEVIKDNSPNEETFMWPSKKMLYEVVAQNQKSNLFLLTGDVHYANTFFTPCEALTGYQIVEYTSSGLTHSIRNFWSLT